MGEIKYEENRKDNGNVSTFLVVYIYKGGKLFHRKLRRIN